MELVEILTVQLKIADKSLFCHFDRGEITPETPQRNVDNLCRFTSVISPLSK
jgi:hypothetical protein